jgi:hypothetical protein
MPGPIVRLMTSTERPAFLITIDTEGDNLWSHPRNITTRNAVWLPKFQRTCEEYGLVATYLTNYEMARCPEFQRFGRAAVRRGTAEIGMHLHAWNSPPLIPLTDDDFGRAPYLIEYPEDLIREKVVYLTGLLRHTFEAAVTSHRAGRFGFDGTYARVLEECGYRVDCSVTPGISWTAHPGASHGGPDFTAAPRQPYFPDYDDVCRPGASPLLEVPVSVRPAALSWLAPLRRKLKPQSWARRLVERLAPGLSWLRPNGRNRAGMLRLLDLAEEQGERHVELLLHSSELMPGGSPWFRGEGAIETLYRDLHAVFRATRGRFRAMALTDFADEYCGAAATAGAGR